MNSELSSRIGSIPPPNAIAREIVRLEALGLAPLNLSDSNPVRQGLAPADVAALLQNNGAYSYEPNARGLPAARVALAHQLNCDPHNLFLCASTSEAYSWAFKLLCNAGDTILVPKPGYPLFDWLARLECVHCEFYPLEYWHPYGWRIDLDALASLARRSKARLLVAINPNNPTGSYVAPAEQTALRALCAELDMALVCDEVFLPFTLETETTPATMAAVDGCLTLVLDGLSKSLCLPQFKLGWIRLCGAPARVEMAATALELIADSFLSASAPIMHSLAPLLERRSAVVENVRARLRQNLTTLQRLVGDDAFRLLRCDGGWTALLQCPRLMSDDDLALSLLRHEGISIQPGYLYDFERDGYLAISLIIKPEIFAPAIERVMAHLRHLLES